MDKRKMTNEEVFKLEANEMADQLGVERPFNEKGDLEEGEGKEYKDMTKKELAVEFDEKFGKDSSKGMNKEDLINILMEDS